MSVNDNFSEQPFGDTILSLAQNKNSHDTDKPPTREFLTGGGEMGERMRSIDWSQTPLGPVEEWSQSLKTAVRIILTSRQPMFVWWGENLINLYNDPYKAIVGGKHPQALGQPATEVWREIWDQVGPRAESAILKNEGTYDEALLLIMERNGYPEETYYTFSYSPVPADEGGTGGIICANTDDTQRIIGERQLKLLRELAAGTTDARTIEEACSLSATYLAHNPYDLPFTLIYLFDQEEQTLNLAGISGIEKDHPAVPEKVIVDTDSPWPFNEVISTNKAVLVSDLPTKFNNLPTGAWERSPHQAVVVPISGSGHSGRRGVLIFGLNPYRLFNDGYEGFINLAAGQIASSIANAQAYEEERKRAEALAEIDQAKTTFFSNVSHEFRTPLTLMLGPIEDMLNDRVHSLVPQQREQMETLHRNSLRLLKLVNTLLDFSRIEAGRVRALYEPTDLATYTAELASTFRAAIEKAGMQLIVNCPPLKEPVYIDHDMWEKIVLNLISNAFKYTLKGQIVVNLRQVGETAELSIEDTGTGIPEEEISHIFERFHRVQGAQGRTFEGTGIGLSLVQELVKLHGGTIGVKSKVGVGSTFTISIPLGMQHLPKDRISQKSALTSATLANTFVTEALRWLPGSNRQESAEIIQDLPPDFAASLDSKVATPLGQRKARIVLADDNADMLEYVSRLLAQRYEVRAVPNGKEALEQILKEPPDLVLSDVMMPQLDGFGLLKELRSNPATSTIPIILLSARAGEEARVEGMEAGADDYLVKPFSARELMARVASHLEMVRIREQAERDRNRILSQFEAVLEQMPAGVIIAEAPDGNIILTNKQVAQIWRQPFPGATSVEQYEQYKAFHPNGSPYQPQEWPLARSLTTGEVIVDEEITLARGDGTQATVSVNASPIRDEKGKITAAVTVFFDISERKLLEKQKDDFIGIASHELKTPVTSLKAYGQVLQTMFKRKGDLKSVEHLAKMDAQINKLTELIKDLLEVTRLQVDKLQFYEENFEFNGLVDEIVEEVQRTTEQHTIVKELDAPCIVHGDRDRIGQVLTNLITNAIKYSPQSNTIIIKTHTDSNQITLCVQDFGIGIAEDKQPYIFERFYRVSGQNQETFSGLGLGLYISAEIVRRQNGKIWVESTLGKGSTFCFSLPLQLTEVNQAENLVTLEKEANE